MVLGAGLLLHLIFLASYWGPWVAVSALVVLLAVWLQFSGRIDWSLPVFAYAVLIKPPFIALAPRWRDACDSGVLS